MKPAELVRWAQAGKRMDSSDAIAWFGHNLCLARQLTPGTRKDITIRVRGCLQAYSDAASHEAFLVLACNMLNCLIAPLPPSKDTEVEPPAKRQRILLSGDAQKFLQDANLQRILEDAILQWLVGADCFETLCSSSSWCTLRPAALIKTLKGILKQKPATKLQVAVAKWVQGADTAAIFDALTLAVPGNDQVCQELLQAAREPFLAY